MNTDVVFEFTIWRPIYHNGRFSHVITRRIVRRATPHGFPPDIESLLEKQREETLVSDNLTVTAQKEYVKSMRKGKMVTSIDFVPDK